MFRIVDCITIEHDVPLLMLAVFICVSGAIASVIVAGRTRRAKPSSRWILLLGMCTGATAWSTHFVAMLAYKSSLPVSYDPTLSVASFVTGIVLTVLGCSFAVRNRFRVAYRCIGGAVVGCGVIGLHYVGMAGLHLPGTLHYDPVYVLASIVLCIGFGVATLSTIFGKWHPHTSLLGVSLLVTMIVSLHFTGMAAIELELDALDLRSDQGVSRFAITMAVTAVTLSTLAIGTVAAVADRHLSNRLATEAERFRTLSDGAFEALIVHRDGLIIDANTAARTLLGTGESLDGRTMHEWIDHFGALPEEADDFVHELDIRGSNGKLFPAEIRRRRIRLAKRRWGELVAIRDLTARKKSDATIAHLALHDPLTDLPNRRFFGELADNVLNAAGQGNRSFAIIAMDLDNFKIVNDVYGHAAGDQLIRTVANRINAILGDGNVVARLGGDEFAILETSNNHPEGAATLAEKVLEALKEPISVESGDQTSSLNITGSIGVAVYPFDGDSIDELLRNADTAMYRAKAGGKATYRFFELAMNEASENRHKIEKGLRRALAHDSFSLAYQPIVSSKEREPICFEALLRWTDDELGTVGPDQFIPIAEASGLMIPIGEFVLHQACIDAMRWPEPIRVAVNLSAVQFQSDDLVPCIHRALKASGLPGDRLELEITESLLIENRDSALRQLNTLKALGIRIAMDDFGTGYSSLSYLQSFGFDKLKIDRVFISNLETNAQNAGIVRAVVSMGQSLAMKVVAEGVETEAQAAALALMACDQLQGYLIARPMPSGDVESFLASVDRTVGVH